MMTARQATVSAHDPLASRPDAAALRATVAAVVGAVHPLAIVLFGSRARGDYRPTSDDHLALVDAPLDVDVIAATPARLVAARGDYSSVLHRAQEEGIMLYDARG